MTTDQDRIEFWLLLPEVAAAMNETAYLYSQQQLLLEICRPFLKGWVISEAACFERLTKADYLRMFTILNGGIFDLQGFLDEAEAILCEHAAFEYGSAWRFAEYRDKDIRRGGSGRGCLNMILNHYSDAYIPNLFPNLLPAPPE
jgi:hypothetical protein